MIIKRAMTLPDVAITCTLAAHLTLKQFSAATTTVNNKSVIRKRKVSIIVKIQLSVTARIYHFPAKLIQRYFKFTGWNLYLDLDQPLPLGSTIAANWVHLTFHYIVGMDTD